MRTEDGILGQGHYARKQIYCKDWLISWSHQRRFQVALDLARDFAGKAVLDYGCGDGTFLSLLMQREQRPVRAVGAEVGADQIDDCRTRLGTVAGLSFVAVADLDQTGQGGQFDAVVCTEVLEHVVEREQALERFERVLKPGGRLIVSVPVEIGLPLIIKQVARRVAGWRKLGDYAYTEGYTWGELGKSLFAGTEQQLTRPVYGREAGRPYHGHKGFNWKVLREEIAGRFVIERTLTSPVGWAGAQFASQIWFVARKR